MKFEFFCILCYYINQFKKGAIWMITELQKRKWKLHSYKQKQLLIYGLKNGLITPYDDELIERLRKVYYGGIPASIILLSDGLTNGYCYDRALLMSRALLEEDDDIQLVYATIDSLKLNPKFIRDDPLYADHCVIERITKDGRHFIYDTSAGFIYDKKIYWLIEHPKVRKINSKESIKKFIEEDDRHWTEDVDRDKYVAPLILPMIEKSFGRPNEMYSHLGIELLQREIEYYKKVIRYSDLVEEIAQDMKRLGLKK